MDHKEATETLDREARGVGLHLEATQVPWSQSRNAKEEQPTVEWRCQLRKGFATLGGEADRLVLAFDYSQGVAHLDGYWQSIQGDARIRNVCEGLPDRPPTSVDRPLRAVPPTLANALYSLLLDGSAIDYGTFEEWAGEFGYDTDSRKAEKAYRDCLEIGLKLRSAVGGEMLQRFQELAQEM